MNLLLLALFFHSLFVFIFKPKGILPCGLFAWSGSPDKWNELNRYKFITLGIEMDSRGKDGCGIAFGENVIKSCEIKLFDELWRNPENIPYDIDGASFVLGHDRKASIGSISFENTQPIIFEKSNVLTSILCHNGTLLNHKELYEKHKMEMHHDGDVEKMSDSQMFALLLEKVGWSILSEYNGGAAIMYYNMTDPSRFFIFHGKSKMRPTYGIESEERPLYLAREDGNVWICSTKAPLERIVMDKKNVEEVPFNTVFEVKGSEVTEIMKIDRSKNYQQEAYAATAYGYGTYDYYGSRNFPSKKEKTDVHGAAKNVGQTKLALTSNDDVNEHRNASFWGMGSTSKTGFFTYYAGKVYEGNTLATGIYFTDALDTVIPARNIPHLKTLNAQWCAFVAINGIVMTNFTEGIILLETFKKKSNDAKFDFVRNLVPTKSLLPTLIYERDITTDKNEARIYHAGKLCSGLINIPTDNRVLECLKGNIVSTRVNSIYTQSLYDAICNTPISPAMKKYENPPMDFAVKAYSLYWNKSVELDNINVDDLPFEVDGRELHETKIIEPDFSKSDYYPCPTCFGGKKKKSAGSTTCPKCAGVKLVSKDKFLSLLHQQVEYLSDKFYAIKAIEIVKTGINSIIEDASEYAEMVLNEEEGALIKSSIKELEKLQEKLS